MALGQPRSFYVPQVLRVIAIAAIKISIIWNDPELGSGWGVRIARLTLH